MRIGLLNEFHLKGPGRTTEVVFQGAPASSGHHGDEDTGARQSGQGDLFKAKEPGENNPNGMAQDP